MALIQTLVPLLPMHMPLYHYLVARDAGPPSPGLDLGELESLTVFDRIRWIYNPGIALDRRQADGVAVWWQDAVTADPTDGGVLLPIESTAYSMLWAENTSRSYAIALWRQTYQGIAMGPKLQHATWVIAES